MPGVAVLELTGFEVEDAGEGGDEEHFGIVARHFGIGRRHELADVAVLGAQRGALVQRLADGHEDAGRQSLAGDVAREEEQAALVEAEIVVEVAAGFAGRDHSRRDVDPVVAGEEVGARQRRGLDPARGFELAGDAGRLLALDLHDALRATSFGVSPP